MGGKTQKVITEKNLPLSNRFRRVYPKIIRADGFLGKIGAVR
jgi:hypothetical protein